jgi:hypothetical protein
MSQESTITLRPSGFALEQPGKSPAVLDWSQVVRVTAFKRDRLTTDLVCFLFTLQDGKGFEIHEELVGFEALLAVLPKAFPGFDTRWRETVIQPAFATNERIVWQRSEDVKP